MSGNINFNGWLNDDGSENYKCRAWVNFNGTGTVAIRASGNVSSITDNGTGDYTVNFTTAMVDANYAFHVYTGTFLGNNFRGVSGITISSGSIRYKSVYISSTSGNATPEDDQFQFITIFR